MGNVYAMDTFCHGNTFHTENNYVKSKVVCVPVNGEYRLKMDEVMVFILKSFCCCFQTQSLPVVLTMLGSVFQMSTLAAPVMKQHLAVARMARMLLLVPTVLGVLVNTIMITASVKQT